MAQRINRRQALLRTAGAGAGVWVASSALMARASRSANDKLGVAIVGCGGRGRDNLGGLASDEVNIVALCDVDDQSAAWAFEQFPRAQRFRDYRKMLDRVHKEFDAVVVSTPDHMHAPISLAAMRLGKHVYCEKPLTWSIEESRVMASEARQRRLATQMGTQGMAYDGARAGIEMIRSGVLGEVSELHVWTDRATGWWPQGVARPREIEEVPAGLDWDLWLGVAPLRSYHSQYVPFRWRGWKDFGTGAVGDMGIHNAAMPLVALQLGPPASAEIMETSGLMRETFPAWSKVRMEFPARDARGPVTLYWYDGGKKPPVGLIGGGPLAANGAIVVGKQATLYSIEWTGGDWHLLPEQQFRDHESPQPTLPRAPQQDQYLEWIAACTGGPPAFCCFDGFAAQLTEIMLVGNLALRTGQKIEWDSEKMQARHCPGAEPSIRREYRSGWGI